MPDINFGSLQDTNSFPFGLVVKSGQYQNLGAWEAVGYNADVGSSFETIWDGSNIYTYPSAATTMNVVAQAVSPATDNGVEVTIIGLDASYNEITETVTLGDDSTGGTSTTQEFLRINRAYVSNGSAPTDDITIEQDGTVYAQITYPYNITQQAVYTVPAGKRGYLVYASISLEKQKEVVAKFMTRIPGGILVTGGIIGTTGSYQRHWVLPPVLEEKTDIEIRAKAGATTSISGSLQVLLEDK